MPQFSPSGRILSADLIGIPTPLQWGWLSPTTPIGYRYPDLDVLAQQAGYASFLDMQTRAPDAARALEASDGPGLYTVNLASQQFTRLGAYQAATRRRFFALGYGYWLTDLTSGAIDARGRDWGPDRSACAVGDRGEAVFIAKADFATILVVAEDGSERAIAAPGFNNAHPVTLRQGIGLWGSADGRLHAWGADDPVGPPGGDRRFAIGLDGTRWIAGYVSPWGLCVYRWVSDGPCLGYVLSTDGRDFNPDLWLGDGLVHVSATETQGDTGLRHYELDGFAGVVRLNGGPWRPIVAVDLLQPPPTPGPEPPPPPPPPPDPGPTPGPIPVPIPVPPGGWIPMADDRPTLYYFGTTTASRPDHKRLYSRRDHSMIFTVDRNGNVGETAATNDGWFEHFLLVGQTAVQNAANPGEPDDFHWFPAFDVSKF